MIKTSRPRILPVSNTVKRQLQTRATFFPPQIFFHPIYRNAASRRYGFTRPASFRHFRHTACDDAEYHAARLAPICVHMMPDQGDPCHATQRNGGAFRQCCCSLSLSDLHHRCIQIISSVFVRALLSLLRRLQRCLPRSAVACGSWRRT